MKLRITPTNEDAENNGIWTSYYGVDLLIARSNNTKFKAEFRKLTQPYQKDLDNGTLPEEKSAELLAEALSGTVLLGWKNFKIDNKEIEFNKINSKNLLIHDQDLREFITDFANEIDNFIIEDREKILGEA